MEEYINGHLESIYYNSSVNVGAESELPDLFRQHCNFVKLGANSQCSSQASKSQLKEFWTTAMNLRRQYRDSDSDSGVYCNSLVDTEGSANASPDITAEHGQVFGDPDQDYCFTRRRSNSWP